MRNRLKKILPFELRIEIYRAFIALHFNYCLESVVKEVPANLKK